MTEPERFNPRLARLAERVPADPETVATVNRINADLAARRAGAQTEARCSHFAAQVPTRFEDAILEDVAVKDRKTIDAWVAEVVAGDGRAPNLVVAGPVGTGKTHAAVAAAREVAGHLRSWLVTEPDLLELLRPGGDEDALDRAKSVPLLLLDDLGAERPNEWTAGRLGLILDRRWREELPIIATTNLALGPTGALTEAIGQRAYSRLVGSDAVVVRLTGPDRRRVLTAIGAWGAPPRPGAP